MKKLLTISIVSMTSILLLGNISSSINTISSDNGIVLAKKNKSNKNKKANKDLKEYIEQDQGFAKGTLDENGKPTDSGTPNPEFNYSLMVKKVKVNLKKKEANVYVTGNFKKASKKEKKELARKIQNMICGGLSQYGYLSDDDTIDGLHLYFYLGKNSIGSSKVLNAKKYSFH